MTNRLNRRQLLQTGIFAPLILTTSCSPGLITSPMSFDRERMNGVSSLIDRLVAEGRIAGGAVRASQHGQTLLKHYAGFADKADGREIAPDTIYRIYSMSKPVTAAAIMILVDDGKLSLDDPITTYIPEFTDLKAFNASGAIEPAHEMTIFHLMTHTSGLSNSFNGGPVSKAYKEAGLTAGRYNFDASFTNGLDDEAARLGALPLAFQPGEQWLYSISADMLGLVVQRISGMAFGDFLHQRIFAPLAMNSTGFSVPEGDVSRFATLYSTRGKNLSPMERAESSPFLKPPAIEAGASGLVSTLDDYGAFAAMLANGGAADGVRVLSNTAAASITAPHVPEALLMENFGNHILPGPNGAGSGMAGGLLGAVTVDPTGTGHHGHAGEYSWAGAAGSVFFVVPSLGLEVTFMTNIFPSGAKFLRAMLQEAVYSALDA